MEKKKTVVEQLNEVKELCAENGRDDLADFVASRIAIETKKANNRKPTKTQLANVELKKKIVEILRQAETPLTATEILNKAPETFEKVQKVTALVTALATAGEIKKVVDKKHTTYTVE